MVLKPDGGTSILMESPLRSIVILVFVFAFFLVANVGSVPAERAEGAAAYKKRCSMCHGADGKGFKALKTPDFTSHQWQAAHSDAAITEVIKKGKKGTAMPAMAGKLGEDEIRAVVAHIRSLNSDKR